MPITRALEFDQTPNKMLYEIGQQAMQDSLMQKKLQQDNTEKQYQLLQQINPATLYPKFEKEVVDQTISGLVGNISSYMKQNPNANYVDLQNEINKGVGQIADWSARVKTVKDTVKQNVSLLGADEPYNRSRLQASAIDKALYKTDELGRKVIKSPEEIDLDTDYVSLAKEDETTIDPFKGQENALKMIQQAPLMKYDDVKTIETPDGRKTTKAGTVSELPFYLQNKDGKITIKQGDNGYIDETVYSTFYTNPATKAWVNDGAKGVMRKLGVPESPEANEYFKRAYLTNWLETQKKGELNKVNQLLYTPKSAGVTVNIGGALGGGKGYEDAYQMLAEKVDSGNIKNIPANISDLIVRMANSQGKLGMLKGGKVQYTIKNLDIKRDPDGAIRIYDKLTGDPEPIYIDPKDFNVSYNNLFGDKAQAAATGTDEYEYAGIGNDGKPIYRLKK